MTFATLTQSVVSFVDSGVIPLLYAFAFLVFIIGMARFFFLEGEEERKKGKEFMFFGIIGLAVIFGVWGVVHLFLSVLPGAGS